MPLVIRLTHLNGFCRIILGDAVSIELQLDASAAAVRCDVLMVEGIGWDTAGDMLLLNCRFDARGDTNAEEVREDMGDGIVIGDRRHPGEQMMAP